MQHPNHVKVSPWGGKIEGQSFCKSGLNRGEVLSQGFIYRKIEGKSLNNKKSSHARGGSPLFGVNPFIPLEPITEYTTLNQFHDHTVFIQATVRYSQKGKVGSQHRIENQQ